MKQDTAQLQSLEQDAIPALTVGLDVADDYTQLCAVDRAGAVAWERRVRTTTASLQRQFSRLSRARVVLEAGTHSPWMGRLLADLGHEVIVANARRVALISHSDRKHDRLDAQQLARLGRLDPQLLAPIHHRGAQAQQDLATIRSRDALVRARTLLVNQVRGTVKAWGARIPRGITAHAFHRKALEHIPEELRPALHPLIDTIATLSARIAEADRRIDTLCEQRYPETRALRQVVGVGPITALAYLLTIEEPRRFAKSRDVGPYLGLVPRRRSSGSHEPQLRITKAGDPLLRRLLVGAARYIIGPFGPDSDLRRCGLRHAASGTKVARNRAAIAVARKLAVLLHALWRSGEVYEPLRTVP